jgi:hypothetical protein
MIVDASRQPSSCKHEVCFFFLERAVRVVGCYICVGVVINVYLYRVWLSVLTVLQALGVSAA